MGGRDEKVDGKGEGTEGEKMPKRGSRNKNLKPHSRRSRTEKRDEGIRNS